MAQSIATERLLRDLHFLKRIDTYGGGWQELSRRDRTWEDGYRSRWQHDKEVRTTHGVNCTGSCGWKVYVKGGIITWETQVVDYPSAGADVPEYEPRGCPRGASFSWYTYSPLRIKHPYVRRALMEAWRRIRATEPDPVDAWVKLVSDRDTVRAYKRARGHGGFVRASWEEALELVAAATVHTIKVYGPDRLAGFSPIPAMSMASYAAGARFLTLLGGVMTSFYDWYCDLPIASPQIWGDQTDVPVSADWYNAGYLIVWGSNVPLTRTPDAHYLAEVRYRGARVVGVSPDYAESTKFADEWLRPAPGTDGALGMAMTHVVLKEFYADRQEPYFQEYAKRYTDLPFLVTLKRLPDGDYAPERFLRASDIGVETPNAEWKLALLDQETGRLAVPAGTLGFRWDDSGRWNLELKDGVTGEPINPRLTLLNHQDEVVMVALPFFGDERKTLLRRGVPALRVRTADGDRLVTTVLDLMFANVGISRGLPGDYPADENDPQPHTPAWQERITGVRREQVIATARGFARNAAATRGRSMIIMGAGINHWYHGDAIYRAILNLVLLCGCQGRNGGGWAHYVGQEKLRPVEGWATVSFAHDWGVPARLQNGTSYWYFQTDQFRYEERTADHLASPLAGRFSDLHFADYNVIAARLGWLPSYPQFHVNPLDLADDVLKSARAGRTATSPSQAAAPVAEGRPAVLGAVQAESENVSADDAVAREVVRRLKDGTLRFAIEDPDSPENATRVLFVWRGNLITSNGKGQEYALKHLLGTRHAVLAEDAASPRPREIVWRDPAPEGRLDLFVTLDFRMSGNALYSDVVLPAATWYEKYDLSTTDMHPFVNPFNPAAAPAWEARSDWDIFTGLARKVSEMGARHLGVRRDLVTLPLAHDSPDELAQPFGRVLDWKRGETEPVPGRTMPRLLVVERDYGAIHDRMVALGPRVMEHGVSEKGESWSAKEEYDHLRRFLGEHAEGVAKGCPKLETASQACETILTLSGASCGTMAVKGWRAIERRTGMKLADLAEGRAAERFTMRDLTAQPRRSITSPAWTGIDEEGRPYSPFVINLERLVPWRTLSGRQHFFVDHEWMHEFGEALPVFRPPLDLPPFAAPSEREAVPDRPEIALRYLTPHGKWNIHSTFWDNERMLSMFRGGPNVWLNHEDAQAIGVSDDDWVEMVSRNGVVMARAVVSHRLPRGMCLYYHVQDRTVNMPVSPISRERGGGHNSLTRIRVKPTQMIGGYAQLSYAFNYYGPNGSQRDEIIVVRRAVGAGAQGSVWA